MTPKCRKQLIKSSTSCSIVYYYYYHNINTLIKWVNTQFSSTSFSVFTWDNSKSFNFLPHFWIDAFVFILIPVLLIDCFLMSRPDCGTPKPNLIRNLYGNAVSHWASLSVILLFRVPGGQFLFNPPSLRRFFFSPPVNCVFCLFWKLRPGLSTDL